MLRSHKNLRNNYPSTSLLEIVKSCSTSSEDEDFYNIARAGADGLHTHKITFEDLEEWVIKAHKYGLLVDTMTSIFWEYRQRHRKKWQKLPNHTIDGYHFWFV